jgi:hypothetical protein
MQISQIPHRKKYVCMLAAVTEFCLGHLEIKARLLLDAKRMASRRAHLYMEVVCEIQVDDLPQHKASRNARIQKVSASTHERRRRTQSCV